MPSIVSVAVGLWLHQRFDYLVPASLEGGALAGTRVLVPFGPRTITGYVIEVKSSSDYPKRLKEILEVLDESPAFNNELLSLLEWAARYYQVPLGELLRTALPPSLHQTDMLQVALTEEGAAHVSSHPLLAQLADRGPLSMRIARNFATPAQLQSLEKQGLVSQLRVLQGGAPKAKVQRFVRLPTIDSSSSQLGDTASAAPLSACGPRGPRQKEILAILRQEGRLSVEELQQRIPTAATLLRTMEKAGLVLFEEERVYRTVASGMELADTAHQLNPDQDAAVRAVARTLGSGRFAPFLLHGVTGSGKTEVYMRLVELALEKGLAALILVPEIALTPQLMARFEARFDRKVAILHSALTPGERLDYWYQAASGALPIVLGARSAIFAPVPNLGLIVVDEEHEASFKQDTPPYYNARDLALTRASRIPCSVVLGSATPSLESWNNVLLGKSELLSLPNRATPRPLPDVILVDLKTQSFADPDRIFSKPLAEAMEQTLKAGQQTILFLNRKGFSQFMLCPKCGYVPHCDHCSVSLTYYKRDRLLRCHYCQEQTVLLEECPICQEKEMRLVGSGTERVMENLALLFPKARCARIDATAGARTAVPRTLESFRRGEVDILVGTQMVAKGHDFPNVTLVGVLQADQGLAFPDLRASERTFQLVTQVAGRAGRGSAPGRVFLQTYMPGHYALLYAQRQDFKRFAEEELGVRKMRSLPPYSCFALYRFAGTDMQRVRACADEARSLLEGLLSRPNAPVAELMGPGPAPIALVSDKHRFQLLLRTNGRKEMQTLLRAAFEPMLERLKGYSGVQWNVDVDPMHIM